MNTHLIKTLRKKAFYLRLLNVICIERISRRSAKLLQQRRRRLRRGLAVLLQSRKQLRPARILIVEKIIKTKTF